MKSTKRLSLYFLLATLLMPGFALAAYDGTPTVPSKVGDCYQIATAADLYGFAQLVNKSDRTVSFCGELTSDITVNENVLDANGNLKTGSFVPWSPIGAFSHEFKGTFEGNHHVIRGLYFNNAAKDYAGLFGATADGTEIRNLGLEDSYIKGQDRVGGLVAEALGSVSIVNSYSTGVVSGRRLVGGLVGGGSNTYTTTIMNSYNSGSVTASDSCVGGLVGGGLLESKNVIVKSYNSGAVNGKYNIGGLVGVGSATITDSYNSGDVQGIRKAGGLVGTGRVEVSNSNNSGSVTIDETRDVFTDKIETYSGCYAGGIVGYGGGTITNSSNSGSVRGVFYIGGLGGYDNYRSTVISSFNSGSITGSQEAVGGLIGYSATDAIEIVASFNEGSVTGGNQVGGLMGKGFGTISNSFNKGEILSNSKEWNAAGGLVGYADRGSIFIENSYNAGSIRGYVVAGLIGAVKTKTTVVNSHNVGNVVRTDANECGDGIIAGLVLSGESSKINVKVVNSFAVEGCGIASETKTIVGYCNETYYSCDVGSSDVKPASKFLDGTVASSLSGYNSVWGQSEGDAYPMLKDAAFPYAISYNLNGGAFTDAVVRSYVHGTEFVLPVPSRDGYTFVGWFSNAEHTGDAVVSIAASESGDKTFYARWAKNSFELVDGCYEIYNVEHLYEFAQIVNGKHATIPKNTAACGKLMENVVVNEKVLNSSGQLNVAPDGGFRSWTPMKDYTGNFNGNNRIISGLYFSEGVNSDFTGYEVGFIGSAKNVTISNLGIVDSYFSGVEHVGCLIGYGYGTGVTISNSFCQGSVKGSNEVGGLAGKFSGSITNSYKAGSVIGQGSVGGLIGNAVDAIVFNSYNTGVGSVISGYVGGFERVGGLVGKGEKVDFTNCYNGIRVSMEGHTISDLVGSGTDVSITNSYARTDNNEELFYNGTIATLLRNGENGSVWGQNIVWAPFNYKFSLPDLSGKLTKNGIDLAEYTITYNLNDGSSPSLDSYYEGIGKNTLLAPIRLDHDFMGWYEDDLFTGRVVTSIAASETGDKTLFAKWAANIAYELNASDAELSGEPTTYTVGVGVDLVKPTRDGYSFVGWYDNAGFTGDAVTSVSAEAAGSQIFYAKWKKNIELVDGCYEINNASQLYEFAQIVNGEHASIAQNAAACGKLMANIVVNENVLNDDGTLNAAPEGGFKAWTPLVGFEGTLQGKGKTISGLYFNDEAIDGVGLIGSTSGSVTINYLGIMDSYFKGKSSVGSFVGEAGGARVSILQCFNVGSVIALNSGVGGFVGYVPSGSSVSIEYSYNAGIESCESCASDEAAGSLVGFKDDGGRATLMNSYVINRVAIGKGSVGKYMYFGEESDFHDGTVARKLHVYDRIWGQNLADPNSLPDFSGDLSYNYGSIVVSSDKKATILGSSQQTANVPSDVIVSAVKFDRTFARGVPSTIVLPFSATRGTVANAKFYAFTEVTVKDGALVAKFATEVKAAELVANTPYAVILDNGAAKLEITLGSPVTLETGEVQNTESGSWSFVGTYEYRHWDNGCSGSECIYGLAAANASNGSYNAGDFVKGGTDVYINPMRAYLSKSMTTGPRHAPALYGKSASELPEVIRVEFGGENGAVAAIGSMNTRTGEIKLEKADRWFDLKGRRLNGKPTIKGTYYNNGKKVVIK